MEAKRYRVLILFIFLFWFGFSNIGEYGRPIDEPPEQEILLMNIKEYSKMTGVPLKSELFDRVGRISESIEQDHGIAAYYLFTPILMTTGRETLASMAAFHMYTYGIWFLGVIALFFLLGEVDRNRWTPAAGTLLYYFSPRMFAESHYNNKDIVLLSLVLVMLMFAARVLNRWKLPDIIGFAIASGFLMNCKIIGIALWGLTGLFALAYVILYGQKKARSRNLQDLALAASLSLIAFFVLTPAMWRFPVSYIRHCLSNAAAFSRWDKSFLFHGKTVTPMKTGVPRTYLIQWILMTTPVCMIVLFLLSIGIFAGKVIQRNDRKYRSAENKISPDYYYLMFLTTFLFPTIASVIKAPTLVLYNGWRHNYYLYAYIVLCAAYSVDWILEEQSRKISGVLSVRKVIGGIIVIGFAATVSDMMIHRSFEYMYFNPAARALTDVEGFEGDYWNVAVMPAMKEFSREFKTEVSIAPVGYAADGQFKDAVIGNLHIVTGTESPDYYLFNTCMMTDKRELEAYEKVSSFQKYGRELCAVYKKSK